MAKVQVVERRNDYIRFVVEGVDAGTLNSLRRVIVSEVPILAIHEVVIIENNSVMYDEVLAHRLGLVPLTTPLESLPRIEECEMGLVDPTECTVKLALQVKAEEPMVVYSYMLTSDRPDVRPVHDNIPLVKLETGQTVVAEVYARLGRAREHAKWQAGNAAYYAYPRVSLSTQLPDKCRSLLEEVCGSVEVDGARCTYGKLKAIESYCGGHVKVDAEPDKYVFWAESYGNMDVESLIREAFRILRWKLESFMDALRFKAARYTAQAALEE